MLTHLLALVVGLGSLALYMSAFFYPEVYRKGDLVWSGVGLFYALVLWICADRITGGVLLGQMASVSLIGWFGWQTLNARLSRTSAEGASGEIQLPTAAELQSKVSEALKPENREKIVGQLKQGFSIMTNRAQTLVGSQSQTAAPTETPKSEAYQPLKPDDFGNPPVTVETPSEPTATDATAAVAKEPKSATETTKPEAKPDVVATLTEIGKSIGNIFKKPSKNTSTYVRKEFREETTEPPTIEDDENAFDFEEDAIASEKAVEEKTVPVNQNGDSESTIDADEIMQEEVAYESSHPTTPEPVAKPKSAEKPPKPIRPHSPAPELVESAIEDAEEKDLPSHPPEAAEEPPKE